MRDKNELASLVGAQRTAPKLNVDILKFNGKTGEFNKIENQEGKWIAMPKEKKNPKGVVIKVRRILQAFGKDTMIFTNEHNSIADRLVLFEKGENKDGQMKVQMIDEGMTKDLRDKYQNLRLQQVLYILIDGKKRYKMNVKGKSLSNLFDYYQELGDSHIFEFETEFSFKEEESKLGKYFGIDFKCGMKTDLDTIGEEIVKIDKELKEIDEYYKSQNPVEETELKEDEIPEQPEDNEEVPLPEEPKK